MPAFSLPPRHTEVGVVFVVGDGSCAQLGLGEDTVELTKPRKIAYFDDKNIVHVVAGGLHNVALAQDGKLYSWGCNDDGALGRAGPEDQPGPVVDGLEGKVIVDVTCGDSCTMALTQEGEVYGWGQFRDAAGAVGFTPTVFKQSTPLKIEGLGKVKIIACGNHHVVCLQDDGKVLTWGDNSQGQLGRRPMSRRAAATSLKPRDITFTPDLKQTSLRREDARGKAIKSTKIFSAVYAGGYHTFLVHQSGALFVYGLNQWGQLGLGYNEEQATFMGPAHLEGDFNKTGIRMIAGGEHHTLLLDANGKVFACGRAENHQLGLAEEVITREMPQDMDMDGNRSKRLVNHLVAVEALAKFNIKTVSANAQSSIAVGADVPPPNSDTSNLWAWGYGDEGQLINDGEGDEVLPHNAFLNGRKAITASAGGQHSVLLLALNEKEQNARRSSGTA
ncbi:Regulator of chromosome condensation [Geranomyces variabilis]|nr:Regulator of chromosome condensation [Geranomyces variabilis]